jgi:hypothetical protein
MGETAMTDIDPFTQAHIERLFADLVAELRAKTDPKPVNPDTVQGPTPEETERLTAQAKLDRWAANPPVLPKLSHTARQAIGLTRHEKTFNQDPDPG